MTATLSPTRRARDAYGRSARGRVTARGHRRPLVIARGEGPRIDGRTATSPPTLLRPPSRCGRLGRGKKNTRDADVSVTRPSRLAARLPAVRVSPPPFSAFPPTRRLAPPHSHTPPSRVGPLARHSAGNRHRLPVEKASRVFPFRSARRLPPQAPQHGRCCPPVGRPLNSP